MVVSTGASGYIKYAYEGDTFGTVAGGAQTLTTNTGKKFGLQDRITTWTLSNNRINLAALSQTELENFAYGTQNGSLSVDFVLSNPWILGSLYGAPDSGSGSGHKTHTYSKSTTAGSTKKVRTFQTEVGYDTQVSGSNKDIIRTLKGCIMRTLNVTATIGGTVDCSADIGYAKEDAPSLAFTESGVFDNHLPSKPTSEFPYTFAHATLKVNGAALAKIQDIDLTFNQNPDLLFEVGSHQAVDAYRRIFEVTGRFRASWVNKDMLEHTLNQISAGTAGTYSETLDTSTPYLEVLFQKDSNEEIKVTLTGIAPTDFSISGLEPVEPVFEDITWQAKSAVIVAKNSETSEE